jgi:hypothetical protein
MKTDRKICTAKCEYLHPELEIADVVVEQGFVASLEFVGKDEEVEF